MKARHVNNRRRSQTKDTRIRMKLHRQHGDNLVATAEHQMMKGPRVE